MVASTAATDPLTPGTLGSLRELYQRHKGSYFCPVCATLSPRFRDGGVGRKRSNAKCPNCGSLERHRLFWLYFIHVLWPRLPARKKDLLHIAPEPFIADLLKAHEELNYLSGDLMMPAAMLKLDLTDMLFHADQLDVIICSHVLEHIPDDRKAMAEMYRVLRPGGFLLVMVPIHRRDTYENWDITAPEDRRKHFGQHDHVRKYGRDIILRLQEAGFTVTDWPTADSLAPGMLEFMSCRARVLFASQKPL